MRRCSVFILCVLLTFFAFLGSTNEFISSHQKSVVVGRNFNGVNRAPARRSLLSDSKQADTAIVAALDGTIYLLELNSYKPIWSFSSGPTIYSSYQAPVNVHNDKENSSGIGSGYFIECGDDWELYAHSKLGKLKIRKSLEEYISSTPQIAEDGGIVLGSKKTTAFLVDAKTGRLIYMYKIDDSSSYMQNNEENNVPFNTTIEEQGLPASMNLKTDEMSLYITRTDYVLTSFAPNSNKVLWNVTVAEIGAAFLCPNIEDSGGVVLLNSVSSETGLHFNMPMPCQSRALVYRFRGRNILEPISWPGRLLEAHGQDMTLPESKANNVLPSQLNVDKVLEFLSSLHNIDRYLEAGQHGDNKVVLPLPSRHESSGMSNRETVEMPQIDKFSRLFEKFSTFHLILFTTVFAVIVRYQCDRMARKKFDINANAKVVSSKRKKIRKSGKNRDFEGEIRNTEPESDNNFWTNLNQPTTQFIDGRTIGKLFVSSKEIAKGSNGTIVLEGIYDGRPVAVKRLVRAHHDIAFKEIQNLIASDQHPNIVRWYGVEQDRDFVYLSLERCICSLHDLIQMHSGSIENTSFNKDLGAEVLTEDSVNLVPMHDTILDIKLWKAKSYPSPILLKIMRDVVYGLVHLHELGIIHRDLKPHNVLIVKDRSLCAKLSDMGISKQLVGDMSSLGHHATGYGSSGWQAPEQLLHGRQTRAVDLFSLGCVLFFCITGGRHPFGIRLERDINIAKNKVDLFLVEHIPEAVDLLSHLLDPKLEMRPKALEVLAHPLFWIADTRLSFLRDTSDRVELEDRETGSELLKALESIAPVALGGKWNEKMEPAFINNIGHYRRYKFDSVRDLLRVMRNKLNHYRELPTEIQKILGPVPEGFDDYFRSRFPKLLIEVYKVMYKYCRKEECFHKYFKSSDYIF